MTRIHSGEDFIEADRGSAVDHDGVADERDAC